MKEARYLKSCLRDGIVPRSGRMPIADARYPDIERDRIRNNIRIQVDRARRAHKSWRMYRGWHAEDVAREQAFEKDFAARARNALHT